jgi:hypothetical protein
MPSGNEAVATAPLVDEQRRLRQLRDAMTAMRDGTFTKRLTVTDDGVLAEIATLYNEIADRQRHLASELGRVRRLAGRDGRHEERLSQGVGLGSWAKAVEDANWPGPPTRWPASSTPCRPAT